MKIFYDTEFIDDGKTIELVSIGLVREDGEELYAVSSEFSVRKLLSNPWLVENVWPSLPRNVYPYEEGLNDLNYNHPDVHDRKQIARLVEMFISNAAKTSPVELWAWYSAYDHIALAQLWGPMKDMPSVIPMFTHDIKQIQSFWNIPDDSLPKQEEGKHNALEDARWNKRVFEWISSVGNGQDNEGMYPDPEELR